MRIRLAHTLILGMTTIPGVGAALCAEPPGPSSPAAVEYLKPSVITSRADPSLELPPFQPGLWEYRRTQVTSAGTKPQSRVMRRCSDPNAEFRRKLAELKQRGCMFTPLHQTGKHYQANWRCTAPDGSVLSMRDSVTVNSPTSYVNESEAFVAQQSTHSSIVAIRQGDCPNGATPPPVVSGAQAK
jgi:hypothetical protein